MCVGGISVEGCPHSPNSKKAEPGAPQSQHRQGAQLWGNGGPQALRGKARGPPPLSTVSGRQHPPREAGANQSQMCEQRKMLIILTRKSPIYREIMK